jgi:hypothetical protein
MESHPLNILSRPFLLVILGFGYVLGCIELPSPWFSKLVGQFCWFLDQFNPNLSPEFDQHRSAAPDLLKGQIVPFKPTSGSPRKGKNCEHLRPIVSRKMLTAKSHLVRPGGSIWAVFACRCRQQTNGVRCCGKSGGCSATISGLRICQA